MLVLPKNINFSFSLAVFTAKSPPEKLEISQTSRAAGLFCSSFTIHSTHPMCMVLMLVRFAEMPLKFSDFFRCVFAKNFVSENIRAPLSLNMVTCNFTGQFWRKLQRLDHYVLKCNAANAETKCACHNLKKDKICREILGEKKPHQSLIIYSLIYKIWNWKKNKKISFALL